MIAISSILKLLQMNFNLIPLTICPFEWYRNLLGPMDYKLSEDLFIDVKGFDSLTGPVQANYEPLKEAVPFMASPHELSLADRSHPEKPLLTRV